MARLGNIQEYEKRKAAAPPVGTTMQSQSVREGFQQMAQKPMEQPVLQKVDPNKVYEATRSQALGSDAAQVNPQKTMESWNASPYEYWTEQVKTNPESTYAIVNQMFASDETPEQKRKRERREQLGEVFSNLGNLIGNAANLYYTHRGGQYIDLNTANEKHRARMQQLKDKQDALDEQRKNIILNAKLGDIQAQRAERTAKAKTDAEAKAADLKYQRDLILKQIDNAYKLGQIDAETKARLTEQVTKAAAEKDLEAFKQQGRIALKGMKPGDSKANDEKILTSFSMPNGDVYTRNTSLDDVELMALAKYMKDFTPYLRTDSDGKEYRDYKRAAVDAVKSGSVPEDVLIGMGYKRSKDSSRRKKTIDGFGGENNGSNKKTISGF